MKFSVYEIVKREKIFGLWKFTTDDTTLKNTESPTIRMAVFSFKTFKNNHQSFK